MAALRKYMPHIVLALGAIVMLLPFYWMVLTSIRSPAEVFNVSLWPIPEKFDAVENYARAAGQVPMARFMLNGFIVCFGILIVQVLTAVPAAYALAKLRFPGRKLMLALVIAALCVPIQALALPLFVGLAKAQLLNTYFAMMAPFFLSVFAIFLFHQSFRSYPDEIIEAARMDGFSEMEICWGIVLRGSLPSLAAFSVFSLVAHWNDLYWPMVVVTDTNLAPPPLGMLFFADIESGANYGALMAGATIITAPMVVCFLLARRHFIAGITMTGVK
ncbi:carbohydrate ABC transporter permease [Brucella thiophenivorans]|uniref:sn-glycerol-3-phosphate transport system permease protein UgpE n=1 Tax=Brucella thiophenivorans TaxID=571255 RepID=A0A256FLH2_9HYPH|nr:carbohydrate ABC transporter permease [Brucella thiophenivorans]OYR15669.1 binding-protein-dependent transport system inner membrane component family protein [Brucella thiophenivorans]